MTKDNVKKTNSSCIKMFSFLKLLYENKADYLTVLNLFKDEVKNNSLDSMQVILSKYINTLRVFGLDIVKDFSTQKYIIRTTLFSEEFTQKDLKAIGIIKDMAKNYPEKEVVKEINQMIKTLETRMSPATKTLFANMESKYDFSFYYSDVKKQLAKCQSLCKHKYFVNLLYQKGKCDVLCDCIPQEVVYSGQVAYLKVFSKTKNMNFTVPINKILSMKILPNVAPEVTPSGGTFVYKITGRLAKTYSLKDNEAFLDIGSDYAIVRCKDEPVNTLMARLMRYMDCCEILTPLHLREMMKNQIYDTLKNYEIDSREIVYKK